MSEKYQPTEPSLDNVPAYPLEQVIIRGRVKPQINKLWTYVLERTVISSKPKEPMLDNVVYIEDYLLDEESR